MENKKNYSLFGSSKLCETNSQNYKQINNEITTSWPKWKKLAYNDNFVTSMHTKKVSVG